MAWNAFFSKAICYGLLKLFWKSSSLPATPKEPAGRRDIFLPHFSPFSWRAGKTWPRSPDRVLSPCAHCILETMYCHLVLIAYYRPCSVTLSSLHILLTVYYHLVLTAYYRPCVVLTAYYKPCVVLTAYYRPCTVTLCSLHIINRVLCSLHIADCVLITVLSPCAHCILETVYCHLLLTIYYRPCTVTLCSLHIRDSVLSPCAHCILETMYCHHVLTAY